MHMRMQVCVRETISQEQRYIVRSRWTDNELNNRFLLNWWTACFQSIKRAHRCIPPREQPYN